MTFMSIEQGDLEARSVFIPSLLLLLLLLHLLEDEVLGRVRWFQGRLVVRMLQRCHLLFGFGCRD